MLGLEGVEVKIRPHLDDSGYPIGVLLLKKKNHWMRRHIMKLVRSLTFMT